MTLQVVSLFSSNIYENNLKVDTEPTRRAKNWIVTFIFPTPLLYTHLFNTTKLNSISLYLSMRLLYDFTFILIPLL